MILIVTAPGDEPAMAVERCLRRRGADVLRFDSADFPASVRITISYRRGVPKFTLRLGERVVRFEELTSVWFRRPGRCEVHASITDAEVRAVVQRDCGEFLQSLWDSLDCRALPAKPFVMQMAQRKAFHMGIATALGFDIAPTIFTNDPAEFLELYRAQSGRLIHKITAMLALQERGGTQFVRLTNPVSARDVMHAQSVSLAPIIFQAYVPKRVELRVTVVGQRVFAAEIDSQSSNRSRIDYRHYDFHNTPYRRHDLPEDVAARCVGLVHRCGLNYGTIDLILTPEDRYVFLELNSAGEYGWIEQMTGLPISEAIADFLLQAEEVDASPRLEVSHA